MGTGRWKERAGAPVWKNVSEEEPHERWGRAQTGKQTPCSPQKPAVSEETPRPGLLEAESLHVPATAALWGCTTESGHSLPGEAHGSAACLAQTTVMWSRAKCNLPTAEQESPGHRGRVSHPAGDVYWDRHTEAPMPGLLSGESPRTKGVRSLSNWYRALTLPGSRPQGWAETDTALPSLPRGEVPSASQSHQQMHILNPKPRLRRSGARLSRRRNKP